MSYEKPEIVDLGDLQNVTLSTGAIGEEDGIGKTIQVVVDPIADVSVGVG